jgi:hypothetical protein
VKDGVRPPKNPRGGQVIGVLDEHGLLDPNSLDIPMGVSYLRFNVLQSVCLGYGDETLIDKRHELITKKENLPLVCNRQDQSGSICTGPVCQSSWTCRSCTCNFHNALCNRHAKGAPPITTNFSHARRMLEYFSNQIGADYASNAEYYEKNWLLKWSAAKIKAIQDSRHRETIMYRRVKSFIKRECGHKPVKKARGIQGYNNFITQASIGPQVYAMQKTLCAKFNHKAHNRFEGVGITFASGMNSIEIGSWMQHVHDRFGKPWFYERDGANWDATMQSEHQDLVNLMYKHFDPSTYEAIQACRNVFGTNRVISKDGSTTYIRYKLSETTKSGHNDTSLRNSIINAAIAFESIRRQNLEAEIIVAGDDLLAAFSKRPDGLQLLNEESKMGIVPEAAIVDHYTKATFISGQWIRQEDGFRFVPLLGRLLCRLFWTVTPLRPQDYHAFKYGVAMGLKPSIGGIPVYRALIDIDKPKKITSMAKKAVSEKYMNTWLSEQKFDKTVEAWFYERYSATQREVKELEEMLRANRHTPCVIRTPLVDRIIARDLMEVTQRGEL